VDEFFGRSGGEEWVREEEDEYDELFGREAWDYKYDFYVCPDSFHSLKHGNILDFWICADLERLPGISHIIYPSLRGYGNINGYTYEETS
jgi:hypothetical protein